ncbi:MAG: TonB-dependent receptor [Candidatus Omnitrophota bacterium]|jgi:iron complex outermembrane receptor protein|nr:MAG: TonB-dependent receptor [Candidatus Omnitrophota bacterium]
MHYGIRKVFIFYLTLAFSLPFIAFADDSYTLQKIIVTPRQDIFDSFFFAPQKTTIDTSVAPFLHGGHFTSLLNGVQGLDVRSRGSYGIQSDVSLRGSTYEQVGILIDGLRVIDPQTGHHNLNIPLTAFDVEKVEVCKEASSSLYGTGALAGSINFVTKKPVKKESHLVLTFGEHALFGQAFSLSYPGEDLSGRFSFDHSISSGARPNTDFENSIASLYAVKEWNGFNQDLLFGYQKKDFGADSFYSNLFPEEEEHTETLFLRSSVDNQLSSGQLHNSGFFRKHRDKFILRRNSPTSVNYHTTYVYGLNSRYAVAAPFGDLLFGADIGRDEIYSTNLGKHARLFNAGLLGIHSDINDSLYMDATARLDHYQQWPEQESYNLGLGYLTMERRLRMKGGVSRGFRVPTFTELYYSDAANKGNADLKAEKSDNFSLGIGWYDMPLEVELDGFVRNGRNLIDWTRATSSQVWQATNLGKAQFKGAELGFKLKPSLQYMGTRLEEITVSFAFQEARHEAVDFQSKYALDIAKQQWLLGMRQHICGLDLRWQLSYVERKFGETYFVGDAYVSKKIARNGFTVEPFLAVENFSNTDYSEIAGVLQPKRWIKWGLRCDW